MKPSLLDIIDQHVASMREFAKSAANPKGPLAIEGVLLAAKGRIEYLQRVVDQRLPSEAEIALQLLPGVIISDCGLEREAAVEEAFLLAEAFNTIKDQRK